jgi:hypothetical protein
MTDPERFPISPSKTKTLKMDVKDKTKEPEEKHVIRPTYKNL